MNPIFHRVHHRKPDLIPPKHQGVFGLGGVLGLGTGDTECGVQHTKPVVAFPLPKLHPQRGVAPARQGEAAVIPRGKIQPFQFQPGSLGAVGFVQGLLCGLVQHGQRLPQGGFGSGGGVIFGVTGGVTEAVLRRLTPDHSKETMHEIAECGVRGDEGIKEFTVPYEGMNLNICVASGLANARTVMEQVKNGEKEYHLIEIMACRRGCIMGGGQPTRSGDRTKALRAKGLYNADNTTIIKKSDENPLVLELYNGLLKGKEHHLLHNDSY